MRTIAALFFVTCFAHLGCEAAIHPPQVAEAPFPERSPSELYGALFERVQLSGMFSDSKTFADAIAKRDPESIVRRYESLQRQADFDLKKFVADEFELPERPASGFVSSRSERVLEHIDALWPILTRPADPANLLKGRSSRLPLAHPYVVPGGRFDELYYWDSYFTMLGLEAQGRHSSVRDLCANFYDLALRYGHVPNGNRSYYLSRSQPPFLWAMIELLANREGSKVWTEFLPALEHEYQFWMNGSQRMADRSAVRRVIRLSDGNVLNRYWDDRDTPRDEAYKEDVETARRSGRPPAEVYRNLRAAAESGWDFSSRWFSPAGSLSTIRTVEIVPVDLNALLYGLESALARGYMEANDQRSESYQALAKRRRQAILQHLWNDELGAFSDLDWTKERSTAQLTAATVVPLFVGLVDEVAAERIARTLEHKLLAPHGLLTSLVSSGQQWDAPNGWAPLVWMASRGLRRYGYLDLAKELERRWIAGNTHKFRDSGKLVEKYDVVSLFASGGGGEYPLQDGFGWTNGVLAALLTRSAATP